MPFARMPRDIASPRSRHRRRQHFISPDAAASSISGAGQSDEAGKMGAYLMIEAAAAYFMPAASDLCLIRFTRYFCTAFS